jgi:hypothetical protein
MTAQRLKRKLSFQLNSTGVSKWYTLTDKDRRVMKEKEKSMFGEEEVNLLDSKTQSGNFHTR